MRDSDDLRVSVRMDETQWSPVVESARMSERVQRAIDGALAAEDQARIRSSNGHAHIHEELREPVRPLRAAELSSSQRNALVDSLVEAVNNHAKVLAEHRKTMESHARRLEADSNNQDELSDRTIALKDAHDSFTGRTFLARLRWIVRGC